MDTDSNYLAFSEDSIEKLIKSEMRDEYEMDKYNFLRSEVVIKTRSHTIEKGMTLRNRHKQNI